MDQGEHSSRGVRPCVYKGKPASRVVVGKIIRKLTEKSWWPRSKNVIAVMNRVTSHKNCITASFVISRPTINKRALWFSSASFWKRYTIVFYRIFIISAIPSLRAFTTAFYARALTTMNADCKIWNMHHVREKGQLYFMWNTELRIVIIINLPLESHRKFSIFFFICPKYVEILVKFDHCFDRLYNNNTAWKNNTTILFVLITTRRSTKYTRTLL